MLQKNEKKIVVLWRHSLPVFVSGKEEGGFCFWEREVPMKLPVISSGVWTPRSFDVQYFSVESAL